MQMVNKHSRRSGFMILMLIAFTSIILGLSVTFYAYCKRGLEDGAIANKLVNQRLALAGALQYITNITMPSGGALAPVDDTVANWVTPIASKWGVAPSPNNPFNLVKLDPAPAPAPSPKAAIISLKNSNIPASKGLGWFRVAYPYLYTPGSQLSKDFAFYFSGTSSGNLIGNSLDSTIRTAITSNLVIIQNCLLVTTGSGPGQGSFSNTTQWELENIKWYLVELVPNNSTPLPAGQVKGAIKRIISVFPPPQSQPPQTPQNTLPNTVPFYW